MSNMHRTATVKANEYTSVASIHKKVLNELGVNLFLFYRFIEIITIIN